MNARFLVSKVLRRAVSLVDPFSTSHGARTCPICGFKGKFRAYGITARPDAECPKCGSMERHRLLKLMLDRQKVLQENCRMLHFAPERSVTTFVAPLCSEYITADYMRRDVDLNLNIEAMDLDGRSFDAVICSHVLEHVDDERALREMFRILQPGGLAILAVPIVQAWNKTYEDPSITTPAGRLLHFGQHDHVRRYGTDFGDRVRKAGFDLDEFVADGADTAYYSLTPGDSVFVARKPLGENES